MMIASTSTAPLPFSTAVTSGMVPSFVVLLRVVPARRNVPLRLQVAVDKVDLLQPAKALPDLLRTQLADAVDRLQLIRCGGQHHVEASELPYHALDRHLGE